MKPNEAMRYVRERLGVTQSELGKSLGLTGTAVSLMESGARKINVTTLQKIAKALSVEPSVFLEGEAHIVCLHKTKHTERLHSDPFSSAPADLIVTWCADCGEEINRVNIEASI